MKGCTFPGCPKAAKARGWCSTHYARWRAHGDPAVVLPKGRPAKSGTNVDVLLVSCWCEANVVRVPRTDVLAGLTGSCGGRGCAP